MSLGELIMKVDWMRSLLEIAVCLSVFVEISPVKINPLSMFFKWAGERMLGDIKRDIQDLSDRLDVNETDSIRWEILDFANSCRNGRKHSKDEFEHVIAQNEKYHKLLVKTKQTNGVFDLEYEYIISVYKHCQETNDFIM